MFGAEVHTCKTCALRMPSYCNCVTVADGTSFVLAVQTFTSFNQSHAAYYQFHIGEAMQVIRSKYETGANT